MMVCMSGVPLLSGRRKRPDRSASASDPRSQYCCTPGHVCTQSHRMLRPGTAEAGTASTCTPQGNLLPSAQRKEG